MNRFRSYIASFFAFLLSAGLLVSTLHVHDLVDSTHVADNVNTPHELAQDHNQCPICAVVFEADFDEKTTNTYQLLLSDMVSVLSDQIASVPIFSSKDGRSPPFLG